MIEIEREQAMRWDMETRVAVDMHLERGTVSEVGHEAVFEMLMKAQREIHPFFIVGRALEQRRRGIDDFRIRPLEESVVVGFQTAPAAALVEAFALMYPDPRALVVPRAWAARLTSIAMLSALSGSLATAATRHGLQFMGIPVFSEMEGSI
jgi:hypothetical protein